MQNSIFQRQVQSLLQLLRWNKPSGRLILLIPAGWSLWLTPNAPPSLSLFLLIIFGGLFISGAGCIANDLWDKNFDKQVSRTSSRPLSLGKLKVTTALSLLCLMLSLSLLIVLLLPSSSRSICLKLSALTLPIIIIYPSAKRWFKYPQAILSICWGFAVLIPWAASESNLQITLPLIFCWGATIMWTFGFDTVYAMSDISDDTRLGLNSSALSLGGNVITTVSICYAAASVFIACSAFIAGSQLNFWPFWLISSIGMQREIWIISKKKDSPSKFEKHFKNQVRLGGLILFGLVISRI